MKEIFIVYELSTGFIKSTGVIDKEKDVEKRKNNDESTMSEYIENKLLNELGLKVRYYENQRLPNSNEMKIGNSGKITKLNQADKDKIASNAPKSIIQRIEELEANVQILMNK